MNVVFRVDASTQIGTGHLMRCLALAEEIKKRHVKTRFLSRHMPDYLREKLQSMGHEFVPLNATSGLKSSNDKLAHSAWLGIPQEVDAKDTLNALSDIELDWMVVDHYALDETWEKILRSSVKNILVIDDIADRKHNCDVLLDQNFYADMHIRYADKVPAHCQLLLGPRYALLRDEFRELHELVKPRTGVVKNILVFFGGIDADNFTGLAIKALSGLITEGIQVNVVIGAQHPFKPQIEQTCVQQGYICHVQTTRMAELMANADLAIGAGGSASWERCCLGLPALLVALANNQVDIAQALDSIGACIYLGTKEAVNTLTIQRTITNLLDTHEQLEGISQCAFSLVDGLGVKRVCQELVA